MKSDLSEPLPFYLVALVLFCAAHSVSARELDKPADLSVSISSAVSTATNGRWVTFYVTAANLGPTPIYAIDECEITFNPASGQYGDDGVNGGDPTDAVVSGPGTIDKSWWDIKWLPGSIAPGQSRVMTVSIPLHIRENEGLTSAKVWGHYSNSNVCDKNGANDYDELQLGYVRASNLSVTINNYGNTGWGLVDGYYELQIIAGNAGPSVIEGAVVTNTLPADCSYEVTWPENSDYYSLDGNILTWNVGDPGEGTFRLWPGVTPDLIVQITPTNGGSKTVTSRIYHPYETDEADNIAESTMLVTGSSGGGEDPGGGGDGTIISVQLMGWDEVPEVDRYGTIHYTLRLKNNMLTTAATDVVITNWIDPRCLFDSASTPQGTVSESNGTVVFNIGTLAAEADLYMNLSVIPLESGVMTNDARLYINEPGNEYGDSAFIEQTTVRAGPYVLTVTPMNAVTPTLGFREFEAVVQTNGQTVAGVPIYAEIVRGPNTGFVTNTVTTAPEPGAPAKAVVALWDDKGYPGIDYLSVTGQVGKIPFRVNVKAEWKMMGPQTYACTNLGYISDNGSSIFELYVPDGFEIADIKTGLHFTHTYPGDLEFRLYSPSDYGQPEIGAYLIEELDAFAFDDLEVGRSDAYCVLDESAPNHITTAVSPFSGSYRSQFMEMTNFIGAVSMGTWRLVIEDMNVEDFDYGELLGWTLTLEPDDGDLDNDGINDDWELAHGLDPNDPNDADAISPSGVSYRSAYRTFSDPENPESVFAFTGFGWKPGASDDDIVLRWRSVSNQFYSIWWNTNLLKEEFLLLEQGIKATPPLNEYTVTNDLPDSAFFYIEQEY